MKNFFKIEYRDWLVSLLNFCIVLGWCISERYGVAITFLAVFYFIDSLGYKALDKLFWESYYETLKDMSKIRTELNRIENKLEEMRPERKMNIDN